MTGSKRDRLVDQTVYEFDILSRAAKRDLAQKRLAHSREVPQMEAALALPDGIDKLVILAE